MSCKKADEELKAKTAKEGEPITQEPVKEELITEEIKDTVGIPGSMVSKMIEDVDTTPQDSLQAIGHVPLPGSGGGKGTTVQKKK